MTATGLVPVVFGLMHYSCNVHVLDAAVVQRPENHPGKRGGVVLEEGCLFRSSNRGVPGFYFFFQSRHNFRMFRSDVVLFMRIVFDPVQSHRCLVPDVKNVIFGCVFTMVADDQLPLIIHTPEVLQSVIRIAECDVVRGMRDTKDAFALLASFFAGQVQTRQIWRNVDSSG